MVIWFLINLAPSYAQIKLPFKLPINPDRLYIKAKLGITTYGGDTDNNRTGNWGVYLQDRGNLFGLTLGYRLNPRYETSATFHIGTYPNIEPTEYAPNAKDISRTMLRLSGRMNISPEAKVQAYFLGGFQVIFGHVYNGTTLKKVFQPGGGLHFGFGLEYALSRQWAIFGDIIQDANWPDIATDSADFGRQTGNEGKPNIGGDVIDYDILGGYSLGVRYNLAPSIGCKPVKVTALNGAPTTNTNKLNTFLGAVSESTEPIDYVWDFGDGRTAVGKVGNHRFSKTGRYVVTFSASNCGGTSTQSMVVNVSEAPSTCEPAVIKKMSLVRDSWDGVTVNFSADVEGSFPIEYLWDYGNGNQSTAEHPQYTYPANGTYNVKLTVRNCGGEQSQTQTLRISPELIRETACTALELKPAYFAVGSSNLDLEMRKSLGDNVAWLRRCKNTCVEVTGYTDHAEGGGVSLASSRAQALKNFYVQNGIVGNRIRATAYGQAPIACDNEDLEPGCKRNRRAVSNSIRCGR